MKILWGIFLGVGLLCSGISTPSFHVLAQCTQPLNSGHLFLTPTSGCTPHTVEIKNLYANSTADTEYRIDWGDGTTETLMGSLDPVDGGAFDPVYTPDFSHTYLVSTTQCGYDIIIEAVNECTLAEDARLELAVSIWDTDEVGMMISPGTFRICRGFAADVQFTDVSDWNCYPRAVRQNDPPREIQWEYVGGTITDVIIPGLGSPPVTGPFESVMDPGNQSLSIPVPAEDPGNPGNPYPVGAYFDVRLNNWNRCNPRAGGYDPVTDMARIIIVETPEPDFVTRENDASQPIRTIFCEGIQIYFDNESSNPGGADPEYHWEFFDDTLSSSVAIHTSTEPDPVFTFDNPGVKRIRLNISDRNAIGNCEKWIDKIIEITPTPRPRFEIRNDSGQVVDPLFCFSADSGTVISLNFVNTSSDTTYYTSWKWEIVNETGQVLWQDPVSGYNPSAINTVNQLFNEPGNYHIRLYARDDVTGCGDYYEDTVRLIPSPKVSFINEAVCEGIESRIYYEISSVNSVDSLYMTEWDFNYSSGNFSADTTYESVSSDSIFHLYPEHGIYSAKINVTGLYSNCEGSFTSEVRVDPVPEISLIPPDINGCSPLEASFLYPDDQDSTEISMYTWFWKEPGSDWDSVYVSTDTISAGSYFSRIFENKGQNNKLIPAGVVAETANGCISYSEIDTIVVYPVLKTGFRTIDYDPLDPNCSPLNMEFEIDSKTLDSEPDRFIWNVLQDDSVLYEEILSGSESGFKYTFTNLSAAAQQYSVRVQADHRTSCFQDSSVRILVNPVPMAAINVDTINLDCEKMEMKFSAAPAGLLSYHWEIWNGTSGSVDEENAEFNSTFARPDPNEDDLPVKVTLQTTNHSYCISGKDSIVFSVPARIQLNPYFEADPKEQMMPSNTVTIQNQTEPGGFTTEWDFGDGYTSSLTDPGTHTYQEPGTYTITLILSDGFCEEIYQQEVSIIPQPPEVDFTFDPAEGCAPLSVQFNNLSKNINIASYRWDFGDDQGGSFQENPKHTFLNPGKYTVSLTAANDFGDSLTEVKKEIITVYENPAVSFTARPALAYAGEMIYTTNYSDESWDFFWDFGDQHYSNEFEPVHQYSNPGIYDITLYAETENGCEGSYTMISAVEVEEGGRIMVPNAFSPDPSGPKGGNINSSGRNDIFYPLTEGVRRFKMFIFNKWGEVIFYSDDLNKGWDGYHKGQLCPQDVYIYKLELEYVNGEEEIKVGDVNLLR